MTDIVDPFAEDEQDRLDLEQDAEVVDPFEEQQTSGELDLQNIKQRRSSGESDQNILNDIVQQGGTNWKMDGQPFDLAPEIQKGTSPTALLDFITSGQVVDTNVDSTGDAITKGIGSAGMNLLGLPVDLVNMASQGIEGGVRYGINKLGGDVSTDPKDFIASSPKPVLGSQYLKEKANLIAEKTGVVDEGEKLYLDRENIPDEFKPYFSIARVLTENAIPGYALLKSAKMGIGLSNPLIKEVAKDPSKFKKIETAATGTAAGAVGFIETIGLGDNPWAMMGAEFVGSILGGGTVSAKSKAGDTATGVSSALSKSLETAMSAISKQAAQKGAVNDILIAAKTQRDLLLDRAKVAQEAGDDALYTRLIEEADAHKAERIISDLENALNATDGQMAELGINLPSGNLTENPVLMGIQNEMTSAYADFRGDVGKELNIALNQILNASENLARAGNTSAANTLRARYFQNLLDTRINSAQAQATARVNELGPDVSPMKASEIAQQTLFEAKNNIRNMETYLWSRIDPSLTVQGDQLASKIDSLINSRILEGETLAGGGQLDAVIRNIYAKARDPNQTISVDEIRKFRSRMLAESRTLGSGASPDYFKAGIFDELANATIDELNTIPDNMGGMDIKAARRFSAELNARFTRYFNQDVLAKGETGGTTIRAEETLDKAMAGSETSRALNMAEMREGAEFADQAGETLQEIKNLDDLKNATAKAELDARTLADDGARVPSTQADNVDDPTKVDPSKIMPTDDDIIPEIKVTGIGDDTLLDPTDPVPEYTIYGANRPRPDAPEAEVTDDFTLNEGGETTSVAIRDEGIRQDLGPTMTKAQEDFLRGSVTKLRGTDGTIDPQKLEQFMSATENAEVLKAFPNFRAELVGLLDAQRTADKIFDQFNEIATSGQLPKEIGKVLTGKNPVDDYTKLASEALGDANALADLRMATIDKLFESAKVGDDPDFFTLTNELTRPLSGRKGDKSILDIMQEQGVISSEETQALGAVISEGLRVQKSTMNDKQISNAVTGQGDLVTNAARIFGANFGAQFGVGEGSQLQAAAIGSSAFKKLVDGLPTAKKSEALRVLMLQPRTLLATLNKNPQIRKGAIESVKEFLINYGSQFKGLSKGQIAKKVAKDVTVGTAKKTGQAIIDAGSVAPLSSSSAFSEGFIAEPSPTVTVDEQMRQLNLQ